MKFLFAVVALFALQGCMAKPSGDANESNLSNMLENLNSMAKNLGEQLALVNNDTNKVNTTINDNTNKLIAEIQSFGDKMKTEPKAYEGEINDKVKEMQEQLHKAQTSLKTAVGEDATKKANELQMEFDKAYTATSDQLQTFYKSQESDAKDLIKNIGTFSKNQTQGLMDYSGKVVAGVQATLDKTGQIFTSWF